jgi:hypothetical protein
MVAGGSAGHSRCHAVDVAEGIRIDDADDRRWDVSVTTPEEARQTATRSKEEASARHKREQFELDIETILDVTRLPENRVLCKTQIKNRSGCGRRFDEVFAYLIRRGDFIETTAVRGNRTAVAWERVFRDGEES